MACTLFVGDRQRRSCPLSILSCPTQREAMGCMQNGSRCSARRVSQRLRHHFLNLQNCGHRCLHDHFGYDRLIVTVGYLHTNGPSVRASISESRPCRWQHLQVEFPYRSEVIACEAPTAATADDGRWLQRKTHKAHCQRCQDFG